jgi:hypothetical protein
MLIIFFDITGLFTKNLPWQAKQPIPHTTVMLNVQRLCPELWRQKCWLLHYNAPSHTSFFTREIRAKNNMTVIPHPHYSSLFPQLKKKLKGHHFYTVEVIKAESHPHRTQLPGCI